AGANAFRIRTALGVGCALGTGAGSCFADIVRSAFGVVDAIGSAGSAPTLIAIAARG
ncbi:MAG: ABC-type enterobactin transport system permease subunit, partial [Polyangiales bacterium]